MSGHINACGARMSGSQVGTPRPRHAAARAQASRAAVQRDTCEIAMGYELDVEFFESFANKMYVSQYKIKLTELMFFNITEIL